MCSLAMCDFSGDGNLEVKYVNIAVSQLIILFNTTIYSALKGLYGSYVSFFVMKHNKKILVNDIIINFVSKNMSIPTLYQMLQTTKLNFVRLKS